MGNGDRTAPLSTEPSKSHGLEDAGVHQGTVIGRYLVVQRVGSGGAGAVYAAYDTQLDRRVALKLLHPLDADDDVAWRRLVREARLLGKLSHPNVVTVFDVGSENDRTFIAMELVDGVDLLTWMQEHLSGGDASPSPRWRETLPLLVQAARGLAAAHESGIVHGDFKPANVLVGRDGRVRVTDFGLARSQSRQNHDARPTEVGTTISLDHGMGDTAAGTGRAAGTPYYMAPEQHEGVAADARADVYSFCVSLFEAVHGERPFEAGHATGLAVRKLDGPPAPPERSAAPAWLHAIIERGLQVDPAERFANASELLEALERPSRQRTRGLGAVGVTVLAGSTALAGYYLARTGGDETCAGGHERLAGVWDESRRDQVREAMLGTGLSYAEDAWIRVEQRLDAYASQWVDQHTRACEATVRGEQSEALLDRRMACLQRPLRTLEALTRALTSADEAMIRAAPDAATQLPALEPCAETERLLAGVAPPEDEAMAQRVEDIRTQSDRARALEVLGRYRDALPIAQTAVDDARSLGHEPVLAESLFELGGLQHANGALDEGEGSLAEAFFLAEQADHHAVAADAATRLAGLIGDDRRRFDEGRRWARHAEAPLRRSMDDGLGRAQLELILGNIALSAAQLDVAQGHLDRALELRTRLLGPEDPQVAVVLNGLGNAALQRADAEAAMDHYRRALEIKTANLGERHPSLGITMTNLGIALRHAGDYPGARRAHTQALELWRESLGEDHPQLAIALTNLGNVAIADGELDEAAELFERSCTINETALGPEHPDVALCLANLGSVHKDRGQPEQGLPLLQRSLTIRETALGPEHRDVAISALNLADILLELERLDEARELYVRAETIFTQVLGPEHPDLAYPWVGLARVTLAKAEAETGIEMLERALTRREQGQVTPQLVAQTRFVLARALDEHTDDHARARTLAEQARDTYPDGHPQRARIDTWLTERS